MLTEKEKLDELLSLGIELNQLNDLDVLLEKILTDARRFVNADAGSIYICHDHTLDFTYTQNDTLQKRLPPGEKLVYSTFSMPINTDSIAGYVASTGQLLNIPDVYNIPSDVPYSFSKKFDISTGYTTRSVVALPLKNTRGDILGILQIINARAQDGEVIPFAGADETLMLHFASVAAVATALLAKTWPSPPSSTDQQNGASGTKPATTNAKNVTKPARNGDGVSSGSPCSSVIMVSIHRPWSSVIVSTIRSRRSP